MKKNITLITTLILSFSTLFSQSIETKEFIKKMTSPEFHGRGYVSKGDKKAVKLIKKKFKKIGLKPYKNFLQAFKFDVNTQPKSLELTINNKTLRPGYDYLVDPGSPSIKGTFKTILIEFTDLLNTDKLLLKLNKSKEKILIINTLENNKLTEKEKNKANEVIRFLKYSSQHPAIGTIILTDEKLTWSGSTVQNSKVSFTINKKIKPHEIETISIELESRFLKNYKSYNCIGFIEGSNKDSLIVLTAHYDHLGRMGSKTYFPGANDNASGVALLLDIAKKLKSTEKKPKYTIVFIAFGGEEIGLLGSKHFIENPLFSLNKIKFLMNFDLAGTGDEGIKIVNGSVHRKEFKQLKKINDSNNLLVDIKPRGAACNSDHCYFDQKGIKCFYSYTLGGIKAYHDIYDKSETLPLTEFEDYSELIRLFINNLQTNI